MDKTLAGKVEILLAIFICVQTGWNIMQMKCKLDLAILLSKHTETVNSRLKMTNILDITTYFPL